MLAGLTGDPSVDVHIGAILDTIIDHREVERRRYRRHLFLARFARQNVLQWDDVEARVVRRYVEMLAEFLKEEGDAVKTAMRQGSAES